MAAESPPIPAAIPADRISDPPPPHRSLSNDPPKKQFEEKQEEEDGEEEVGEEEEEEEEDVDPRPREPKRRRTCPAALEGISSSSTSAAAAAGEEQDAGFSFSFDTRGFSPIDTTPKFGSFNSAPDLELGKIGKEEESGMKVIKENDEGENRMPQEGNAGNK